MKPGEELVVEPFQRLIAENQLIGYPVSRLVVHGHLQGAPGADGHVQRRQGAVGSLEVAATPSRRRTRR